MHSHAHLHLLLTLLVRQELQLVVTFPAPGNIYVVQTLHARSRIGFIRFHVLDLALESTKRSQFICTS